MALFASGQWAPLAACLGYELEAARAIIRHPDFVEGVRAVLVDKTRDPRWQGRELELFQRAAPERQPDAET